MIKKVLEKEAKVIKVKKVKRKCLVNNYWAN
jgi:hypothetical protein